jgi:hypothetical protein
MTLEKIINFCASKIRYTCIQQKHKKAYNCKVLPKTRIKRKNVKYGNVAPIEIT